MIGLLSFLDNDGRSAGSLDAMGVLGGVENISVSGDISEPGIRDPGMAGMEFDKGEI